MFERVVVNGVVVQKPFWESKKIWLLVIALGLALYQAITHKGQSWTPEQIAGYVAIAATYLGPIIAAILAIAHVDANTRGAAIAGQVAATLAGLNKPDVSANPADAPPSP